MRQLVIVTFVTTVNQMKVEKRKYQCKYQRRRGNCRDEAGPEEEGEGGAEAKDAVESMGSRVDSSQTRPGMERSNYRRHCRIIYQQS